MSMTCVKKGVIPAIALAVLLVAAQSMAAMHSMQHESGTAQNAVCATCVAAAQLGTAAVDTSRVPAANDALTISPAGFADAYDSVEIPAHNQRGPPAHF